MAAVVQCECCGRVAPAKAALHIRVHRTIEPGTYVNSAEDYFDVCKECYKEKILKVLTNKERNK